MNQPLNLTDAELVARLTQTEDSFVERKSKSDKGGWLKTAVAFANSVPVGLPAVLFIGVDDNGQIADNVDTEKTLQTFSDVLGQHAWPPIYTLPRALVHDGKSCVAVIIPGSPERPHFAGKSFVREGTQTKEASESQFSELIASRNSKARAIQEWVGKDISWMLRLGVGGDQFASGRITVAGCNSHYATFEMWEGQTIANVQSEPLSRIELGFDRKRQRLQVILYSNR